MKPNPTANRKFLRAGGSELAVCGELELPIYTRDGVTHLISIQDAGYRDDSGMSERLVAGVTMRCVAMRCC
mgnify:CR=1 FL=1